MAGAAGIRMGWTGKLPCRGDFVTGGALLEMFGWFERWASEGMVAVRDGGGPAADAFLTSDLQRVVASSRLLGPHPVMAVIGPGMDRAARLYPFLIAVELPDEIAPMETLDANAGWFDQVEELFLTALAPDFDPAHLPGLVGGLPAPQPVPPEGLGRVFAHGILGSVAEALGAPPPLNDLFGSGYPPQRASGGGAGQLLI